MFAVLESIFLLKVFRLQKSSVIKRKHHTNKAMFVIFAFYDWSAKMNKNFFFKIYKTNIKLLPQIAILDQEAVDLYLEV